LGDRFCTQTLERCSLTLPLANNTQLTHGTCGVPNQGAGLLDPLDDVPRLGGGPLAQLSVVVEPLEDGRSTAERAHTDVVEQGGTQKETITDDAYEGHSVPMAVTNAMVEHLRATEVSNRTANGLVESSSCSVSTRITGASQAAAVAGVRQ
jgi:hypothetical protein